jgi:hypothetical protein
MRTIGGYLALLLTFLLWLGCDMRDSSAQTASIRIHPKAAQVGQIKAERITEASGLAASRRFDGVFWTHNDGNDGVLFAVKRDGSLVGSVRVDARIRDWEDIAADEDGNIYVADIGNNEENRRFVNIFRVREPDPAALRERDDARELAVERSWRVEFAGEPSDAEGFFVWRGFGYITLKLPEGMPAEVYRFDLNSSAQRLEMEKVATLNILKRPVTAADLSADGNHLALLTRGDAWVFDIGGDVARAGEADVGVTRIAVSPLQTEGCGFTANEIVIVAETGEMFAAPFKASSAPTSQPATP